MWGPVMWGSYDQWYRIHPTINHRRHSVGFPPRELESFCHARLLVEASDSETYEAMRLMKYLPIHVT